MIPHITIRMLPHVDAGHVTIITALTPLAFGVVAPLYFSSGRDDRMCWSHLYAGRPLRTAIPTPTGGSDDFRVRHPTLGGEGEWGIILTVFRE